MRKIPPGRPSNQPLPEYIRERMIELEIENPTYNSLSMLSGISYMTLYNNLTGKKSAKLSTVKQLAACLEVELQDFVENVPLS